MDTFSAFVLAHFYGIVLPVLALLLIYGLSLSRLQGEGNRNG